MYSVESYCYITINLTFIITNIFIIVLGMLMILMDDDDNDADYEQEDREEQQPIAEKFCLGWNRLGLAPRLLNRVFF